MIDPFELKRVRRVHPKRFLLTMLFRAQELYSRLVFETCRLPEKLPVSKEKLSAFRPLVWSEEDTAVTPTQAGVLRYCAEYVKSSFAGDVSIVEVGSFRGLTTRWLAENSDRTVYAVDPFMGYGGSENDLNLFLGRTREDQRIKHVRSTSGSARLKIGEASVGLVFIDAVHDFANTMFDALNWEDLVVSNGLIAFHDVDEINFAGTRRAAFLMSKKHELFAHIDGLVVLRKK